MSFSNQTTTRPASQILLLCISFLILVLVVIILFTYYGIMQVANQPVSPEMMVENTDVVSEEPVIDSTRTEAEKIRILQTLHQNNELTVTESGETIALEKTEAKSLDEKKEIFDDMKLKLDESTL